MWFPSQVHTNFSLLRSPAKPADLARRAVECGYKACAVTDLGSVSGVVEFSTALRKACRHCGYQPNSHADAGKGRCMVKGATCEEYAPAKLKPVLGCEFTVGVGLGEEFYRLPVLARTREGWEGLCRAVSAANTPEHWRDMPTLPLDLLAREANGKWAVLLGGSDSEFAHAVFTDFRAAMRAPTVEGARSFLRDQKDVQAGLVGLVGRHRELFGPQNVYLGACLRGADKLPALGLLAKAARWVGKREGVPVIAAADVYYARPDDWTDHRVVLAVGRRSSMADVEGLLKGGKDDPDETFFRANAFSLPSPGELKDNEADELNASLALADGCEDYDVTGPPLMPTPPCPPDRTPVEHLRQLCRDGWRKRIADAVPKGDHARYGDRIKMELGVFEEAGLAPYFLVVHDYCQWARNQGMLLGRARGSGGGCLTSYLLGITGVDPVRTGLFFERFYNAGRNSPGRVSMPDIDTDFPVDRRDEVVAYVRSNFGHDRVAQIGTFQRMMGASAIKDVFRARGRDHREADRATEFIPDQSRIADELQEMMEEHGEASILRWALLHQADKLKPWCHLDKDGELAGPYGKDFAQAIRLEGVKRAMGKHPSGIVISPRPLHEFVPMVRPSKGEEPVIGLDMNACEAAGLVKMDILGVSTLSKLSDAESMVRYGRWGGGRVEAA
jgi:DNA polymerase-3 subunit alpha